MTQHRQTPQILPKPAMHDAERDTLGLLVQALKYAYVEHFDTLQGSSRNIGALRNNAKFLAEKLSANCQQDIKGLYNLIEKNKNRVTSDMGLYQPLYDAIDCVQEMIETAMVLSRRTAEDNNSETSTFGVVELRQLLKDVREGNVAMVPEEKFQGMKRCGML